MTVMLWDILELCEGVVVILEHVQENCGDEDNMIEASKSKLNNIVKVLREQLETDKNKGFKVHNHRN